MRSSDCLMQSLRCWTAWFKNCQVYTYRCVVQIQRVVRRSWIGALVSGGRSSTWTAAGHRWESAFYTHIICVCYIFSTSHGNNARRRAFQRRAHARAAEVVRLQWFLLRAPGAWIPTCILTIPDLPDTLGFSPQVPRCSGFHRGFARETGKSKQEIESLRLIFHAFDIGWCVLASAAGGKVTESQAATFECHCW